MKYRVVKTHADDYRAEHRVLGMWFPLASFWEQATATRHAEAQRFWDRMSRRKGEVVELMRR